MKTLSRVLLLLVVLLTTGEPEAGERVTVLTLNVAGLPDLMTKQDNPEMRMLHTGRRAQLWDLVAYQEDFYYSEWLDAAGVFDRVERGTKMHKWAWVWPWLRKSGLTLSTNWKLTDPYFRAYSECFGHLDHGNDCWVPKGVLCARTETPGGVIIDFCTTHMDAGNDPGSSEARVSQIREYQREIPQPPTEEQPWMRVETGDYNLRIYQEAIAELMDDRDHIIFNDNPCTTRNSCKNDVDFITITTNNLLSVSVVESGRVPMFDELSDHPAIGVILDLEY